MSSPHILIVEDEPMLLRVLGQIVGQRLEKAHVETCDSAEVALERIRAVEYDAILTDIRMPNIDGMTLLRAIRDLRPDTPTLLMTGHAEHDLAVEALRAGAFDYLEKPVDINYLVASLLRAIRTRD